MALRIIGQFGSFMAFQVLLQMSIHLLAWWNIYQTNEVQSNCRGSISTWWWGGSFHWPESSSHESWGKNHTSNSATLRTRGPFESRSGNRLYVYNNCLDWKRCLRALPGAHSVPLFLVGKQTRVLILTEWGKNWVGKLGVFLCLNNAETGRVELDHVCQTDFLPWTDLFATSFLSLALFVSVSWFYACSCLPSFASPRDKQF